jgi:hypothetical protein
VPSTASSPSRGAPIDGNLDANSSVVEPILSSTAFAAFSEADANLS